MKKILLTGLAVLGTLGMFACERTNTDNNDNDTELEDNKAVVDRDTIVTEYEVEETIVEYDTTTRKKTVDAEDEDNDRDRDNNN